MVLGLGGGRSYRRSYLLDPKATVFAHCVRRVRLFWARLLPPSLHILSRDLLATRTTFITLLVDRAVARRRLLRLASVLWRLERSPSVQPYFPLPCVALLDSSLAMVVFLLAAES